MPGVVLFPVPPLATGKTPATSDVFKSTASVVEPVPINLFDSTVPPPKAIVAPDPTVIVAVVFVPDEIRLKGTVAIDETMPTHCVPLKYSNLCVSRLYITKPVAGLEIAFLWVVVNRGTRKPCEVEYNSKIAELSGVVVPIPTFCCENNSWQVNTPANQISNTKSTFVLSISIYTKNHTNLFKTFI